ncbi:hypothetical protein MRX96_039319 [Rhipicephalus microplus]
MNSQPLRTEESTSPVRNSSQDWKLLQKTLTFQRQNHGESEKRRRDKMNMCTSETAFLVPMCKDMSRKPDKFTVLRMGADGILFFVSCDCSRTLCRNRCTRCSLSFPRRPAETSTYEGHPPLWGEVDEDDAGVLKPWTPRGGSAAILWYPDLDLVNGFVSRDILTAGSRGNSEVNDEAAMAVIMSLPEAHAESGGLVDFSGMPWPLP